MEILDSAKEFLQTENDEFDSKPNAINISTADYDDNVDFIISGRFPNEPYPDERILPPEKQVSVDSSSALYDEISELFARVRENLGVTDAVIDSISLSKTVDDSYQEYPFYTSETADARIFVGIGRERVSDEIKDELVGLLLEELYKIDDSVSADDIRNVEYLFDDIEQNFNHCLRGEIWTQHPYRYYSNVSSLDEYTEELTDSSEEKSELEAQDKYKVPFFESMFVDREEIDDGKNTVPPTYIRDQAESIMADFVNGTLNTQWETMFEAESISFGEFDYNMNGHEMKYWVYIPVTDGVLGTSR